MTITRVIPVTGGFNYSAVSSTPERPRAEVRQSLFVAESGVLVAIRV